MFPLPAPLPLMKAFEKLQFLVALLGMSHMTELEAIASPTPSYICFCCLISFPPWNYSSTVITDIEAWSQTLFSKEASLRLS